MLTACLQTVTPRNVGRTRHLTQREDRFSSDVRQVFSANTPVSIDRRRCIIFTFVLFFSVLFFKYLFPKFLLAVIDTDHMDTGKVVNYSTSSIYSIYEWINGESF